MVGMGHMGGASGNMFKTVSPDWDGACGGGGRHKAGSHGMREPASVGTGHVEETVAAGSGELAS